MTDINLFPHIDTLSEDLCLVAVKPDTGITGHFTLGELKAYLGSVSPPPSNEDEDVIAVITAIEATGITLTEAQKSACTNRIKAFKVDGVWNQLIGYYGFLGGTAASHSINWKNPGTYDLAWAGEIVHSAEGVQGDGVSGRALTGFNPAVFENLTTKTHMAFYCRSSGVNPCTDAAAAISTGVVHWNFHLYHPAGNRVYYDSPLVNGRIFASVETAQGYTVGSVSDGSAFIARNGQTIAVASLSAASIATINSELVFMAYPYNGGFSDFSNRQYSSFSFGYELNQTIATANYNSEQIYQAALGRQL